MITDIIKYVLRFLALLLLQVFIIGKLDIGTYINPNIIVYFLLLLPINQLPAVTLITAFAGGLFLDMFTDTPGYNSTALLVTAYARIYYIRSFAHIDVVETGIAPNVVNMGVRWFFFYSVTLVLLFHLIFVFVQSFTFSYFLSNIVETVLSTVGTLVIIFLAEFLFYRSKVVE